MGKKKIADLADDLEDAIQSGDRSLALMRAVDLVAADPEHVEGLSAVLHYSLPPIHRGSYRRDPTLMEAAKGWNIAKKIVNIDPSRKDVWTVGAHLLSVHLGMTEEVLQWWENYRGHYPSDPMPIIQQSELLIRMGDYAEASRRLSVILEDGMDETTSFENQRIMQMNATVQRFFEENTNAFRPQDPKHPSWKDIEDMRNLKPASEKFTFFMLAGPAIIWEAFALQVFMPKGVGCWGMGFAFMLVYASILFLKRISIRMTDRRNRPVRDLWRALEVEATSGQVCIPENIRQSKLYGIVINTNYTPAFRDRIEKIVDMDEKLSKRWKMTLPEWKDYEIDEEE